MTQTHFWESEQSIQLIWELLLRIHFKVHGHLLQITDANSSKSIYLLCSSGSAETVCSSICIHSFQKVYYACCFNKNVKVIKSLFIQTRNQCLKLFSSATRTQVRLENPKRLYVSVTDIKVWIRIIKNGLKFKPGMAVFNTRILIIAGSQHSSIQCVRRLKNQLQLRYRILNMKTSL